MKLLCDEEIEGSLVWIAQRRDLRCGANWENIDRDPVKYSRLVKRTDAELSIWAKMLCFPSLLGLNSAS